MLRERNRGFIGNLRLGCRAIDHKDQRLACPIAKINRGTDGAKIVRAWPSRHDDEFGNGNNALDRHRDGGRGIDHGKLEALLPEHFEITRKSRHGGLRKGWKLGFAFVPPVCE